VYEPDSAILAAGLAAKLASEHGWLEIAPGVGYLTGGRAEVEPAVAGFEVLEVLPFDLRKLKAALRTRGWGRLEIKKRGVAADPAKLTRELRVPGDHAGTVILTPHATGVKAILARRLPA
jgi:hypothetical protein